MEFNGKKFEHITFHANGKTFRRAYKTPDGKAIKHKETLKDLRVHLSSNCEFAEHIHNTVKATQKRSSWALRTFRSRDEMVMRTLLQSKIIPIVWSPTNRG